MARKQETLIRDFNERVRGPTPGIVLDLGHSKAEMIHPTADEEGEPDPNDLRLGHFDEVDAYWMYDGVPYFVQICGQGRLGTEPEISYLEQTPDGRGCLRVLLRHPYVYTRDLVPSFNALRQLIDAGTIRRHQADAIDWYVRVGDVDWD